MGKQKWTAEPWRRCGGMTPKFIAVAGADDVLVVDGMADRDAMARDGYRRESAPDGETQRANADRIVSCVNALAGLNPEGVRDLIAAAEKILPEVSCLLRNRGLNVETMGPGHSTKVAYDELSAALSKVKATQEGAEQT